jgi:thiol-disulfide isomerase/thioredoxin
MTAGVIALFVAVAVALTAGVAFRFINGRMRRVGRPDGPASSPDAVNSGNEDALAAAAVTATGGGYPMALSAGELGRELGDRATLLQFSSAFCAPCRATRRILADVAGMIDGVEHVEVDAESHLDLVGRLNVRRTPTVFVLGPDGRITRRASGQPRKQDVIAALSDVMALTSAAPPPARGSAV